MKKKWFMAALAACAIALAGCKIVSEPEPVAVESVTLNATTLTLAPGDTRKLTATVKPDNADDKTVAWSSSNADIATVDSNGTVGAIKTGMTIITAQAGEKTVTCTVIVKPNPVAVESVTLDATEFTLTPGATRKLTATVMPSNADDKTVVWSSSDMTVAMVGNDGTVGAIKTGTTTITAQAGEKTVTCLVTVSEIAVVNPDSPVTVERITLGATTLTIEPCKTRKLTATVTPSNADDKTVIWSSSDEKIATVSDDGTIMAHEEGTVTITARAGGKETTCTVTVKTILIAVENIMLEPASLTLTRGETGKLSATVTPDNADDMSVAWSSSDADIATVDNEGTVTANKAGTATITAQAGEITATCTVTVNPILVQDITLDKATLTLTRGETGTLTATVTPDNADDKTVAWSSSNTDVATVGNYGTVIARKAGTAIITVQSGSKTATCVVTVNPILVESVTLYKTTLTLAPGMTGKLTATVKPDNADDKTVKWSSSNTSVAMVDNDGTVGAIKTGETTITAQAGGITTKCEVTVHTDHSYSEGKCTLCGASPYLEGGTIDYRGVLTKYSGSSAMVTIPEGVTGIGGGAFSRCTSLVSVDIPDSVTSIGSWAFRGCTNLTNVTIPGSVTSIEDYAFYVCTNLASVTISDGVTSIGEHAFSECTNLASVDIPDSVTSIGSWAFNNCSLMNVLIPDGVTSIGDGTFSGCASLVSVTIPGSVTSIGDSAFSGCTNLASVNIPDGVTSIGGYAFKQCRSLMNVVIPDGVTSIESDSFWGCTSLTNITIPSSVTSIGYAAFCICKNLESVTISEGVENIEEGAFDGCSSLISVVIPDSVMSIGRVAFSQCTSLTSVTISGSVMSIGELAFSYCNNLTNVKYNGTKDEWGKIERYKSYTNNRYDDNLSGKTITGSDGSTWIAE